MSNYNLAPGGYLGTPGLIKKNNKPGLVVNKNNYPPGYLGTPGIVPQGTSNFKINEAGIITDTTSVFDDLKNLLDQYKPFSYILAIYLVIKILK